MHIYTMSVNAEPKEDKMNVVSINEAELRELHNKIDDLEQSVDTWKRRCMYAEQELGELHAKEPGLFPRDPQAPKPGETI
jgi:hypothetical protein